ncbi:hypothetical protein [Sulfuracidifex metallicus]|uniref:hypothetical protein n=1 Tax=Sulfuracidifex metallicus TaxID=47303 RepID=UPI002274C70B|nr:hypothetical protein [Sulfuracidifex metallicus]MCY0850191.1 hypothetical protein [Sulfuracidifex metallicus]
MSTLEENLKPSIVLLSASDLELELKELKEEIKSLRDNNDVDHSRLNEKIDNVAKSITWLNIARSQGMWKSRTCRHMENDACSAWNVNEPEKLGIPAEAVTLEQTGIKRISVLKFPELCIACPLYEAKRS